ncbi:MAG: hypothetical protein HN580_06510 [Deltaproteobacteria bacterium]|jgi:TRAP-type uncharacterized transport system substrate-binding protein|nr:hypothetical protein [Deltaproteobacteria bacterium]MBT6502889.1 hypothetical protein [Deltaproteobacteria bacterium]MBT7888651.1 hypothetical protein [Deltaproteobacteria bacterium]
MTKSLKRLAVFTCIATVVLFMQTSNVWAAKSKRPYDVTFLATPMGSAGYTLGTALEIIFAKHSWVKIKNQETPGAMYGFGYIKKNLKKMEEGKVNQIMGMGSSAVTAFIVEGRKPLTKLKLPQWSTIANVSTSVTVYGTFDKDLTSTRQFAGRNIGTGIKSTIFRSILRDRPYFGRGLNIYGDVKWNFLDDMGNKDAILNGKLDAVQLNFGARMAVASDGSFYTDLLFPQPAAQQIIDSGRKLYVIPLERDAIINGYDFSKDMIVHPIKIKKGAYRIFSEDAWATSAFNTLNCLDSMPDDVVEEIIRVMHTYRDKFANYHASFKALPENPYPVGTPKK